MIPSTSRRGARTGGAAAVLAAVVALSLLGACSRGRTVPDDYNADLRADFVESCTETGGDTDECECTYDNIEDSVPFDRFQEITDDLEEEPGELPDDFVEVYTDCIVDG